MAALLGLQDINYETFANSFIWIRDKRGDIIPFQLNPVQKLINKTIAENRRKGI